MLCSGRAPAATRGSLVAAVGSGGSHRPAALGPFTESLPQTGPGDLCLGTHASDFFPKRQTLTSNNVPGFSYFPSSDRTQPCSSQSASLSVVHNSLICSSITQAPKLESPGWPMTFLIPPLHIQCSLSVFALRVSQICPPSLPVPCPALVLAS